MSLAIRVWTVGLDQPPAVVSTLLPLLDADETEAAARRAGPHRDRYVVAHGAARSLLAHELGAEPSTLEFARSCEHCDDPRHGRPRLVGRPDVQYSLSHSAGLGVVAMAVGSHRIGVDVEVIAPRRSDLDALAKRVLHPLELDEYRARPPGERLRAFLARWTAKEAYLKAIGRGVVRDLRTVEPDPPGWAFAVLDLDQVSPVDAVGTLAVEAPEVDAVTVATWWPPLP